MNFRLFEITNMNCFRYCWENVVLSCTQNSVYVLTNIRTMSCIE